MPQRRDDANGSLKTGLKAVQRIVRRRHQRIYDLIIFQKPHKRTVAHRAHEIFRHILRAEEIDDGAVLHNRRHADVSMLAVPGQTDHRLRFENDFEAVFTEYFLDQRADEQLVVRAL